MSVQKQMRERIARARAEAKRLAFHLERPNMATECHDIVASSATIVYTHGGRVYHAVVYDMGTAEQYTAEIGDAATGPATEALTVPSSELRVGDRLVEWSIGGALWHPIGEYKHGARTARILEIRADDMRTEAGVFAHGKSYQWKIERTVQP